MVADMENQPQDKQQLHCDKSLWSNKKLYMTHVIELHFSGWNALKKLLILDIIFSVNAFVFLDFCSVTINGETVVGCFQALATTDRKQQIY